MRWLRAWTRRLLGVFLAEGREQEISEELACHLQLHIDENVRFGMQLEEARQQAKISLGLEQARQAYYTRSTIPALENLFRDVRFGLRSLLKSPGYTIVIVLSLALGIGATTAVFSVIYGVLLNPYPYPSASRMVHLLVQDADGNLVWPLYSGSQFEEVKNTSCVHSAVGYRNREWDITGNNLPEELISTDLTSNGFSYFGVHALIGRGLEPSDVSPEQVVQPVTVLGYKFWLRYYDGNRNIIGKTIQLNHRNYTIVGVAPPRFTWGNGDLFLPAAISNNPSLKLEINLRLKQGVSIQSAQSELGSLLRQFAIQNPNQFPRNFRTHLTTLNEVFEHRVGPILYLLLGAVGLLLLIGCSNVSILSMARGTGRKHEMAVKSALGANRFRLLCSLLAESLLLSLMGAGVGILLAYQLVDFIRERLPQSIFPGEAVIRINLWVLIFCVVLSLTCGIFSGLAGGVESSRPQINQILRANSSKVVGRVHGKLLHHALIACQVALTFALLTGAGAAMQTWMRIAHRPLGFDPHHVMEIGFPVDERAFPDWKSREQYLSALRDTVASTPGVVTAAISLYATPPNSGWKTSFFLRGQAEISSRRISAHFVSASYFGVLHIPLLSGNLWNSSESIHGAQVGLINQAMEEQLFGGQNPIGQFIRLPKMSYLQYSLPAPKEGGWIEIIGVVGNIVNNGLNRPVEPALYMPFSTLLARGTQILVRTKGQPLALLSTIQNSVQKFNAAQAIASEPRDLENWIRHQPEWVRISLIETLFSGFSLLALALAAFGLFSVVAYSVAQRTNEFGVRMALGAQHTDILKAVLGSIAKAICAGAIAGWILVLTLRGLVNAMIATGGSDILALVCATLLLIIVSALACLIPAYRATTVNPVKALHYE